MKTGTLILVGLTAGVLFGATLGLATSVAWVTLLDTAHFDDFTVMLVFFTFSPIGALLGGITGAALPGLRAMQSPGGTEDITS